MTKNRQTHTTRNIQRIRTHTEETENETTETEKHET